VVSYSLQLLYPGEKSTKYAFIRLCRCQSQSEHLEVEKNLLTLLLIEPWFLSNPEYSLFSSLFNVPTTLSWLSLHVEHFPRSLPLTLFIHPHFRWPAAVKVVIVVALVPSLWITKKYFQWSLDGSITISVNSLYFVCTQHTHTK